jgi:nuclear pore complex protein Nup107
LQKLDILRQGFGNVNVAKLLLDDLPPELASIGDPEEIVTEYMHYRQFFTIWQLFDRIVEVEALEIQGRMTKDTRMAWLEDYSVCFRFT